MNPLQEVDYTSPGFGDVYDELPLWSAPFGLLLLERVPLARGITILDVGAGTGFLSIELAQRCGPDSRVIAVDPWKAGLARLRSKLEQLDVRNVELFEQDAATLELPDASVDLVVSNLGINNFENAEAVLRTCFRVARPGAALCLTTNLVGHMQELYDVFRAVLAELGQGARLAAFDAHVAHRGTLESVTRLLERAGFEIVDSFRDSFRIRFADGSSLLRHWFIRLGFLPAWKELVAPEVLEQTFAALERRLDEVAAEQGELALTIPMAYLEARKPESSPTRGAARGGRR